VGAERIEATVETLLATARQGATLPPGTGEVVEAAGRVADGCSPLAAQTGVALVVEHEGDGLRAGVEADVVERILQPVLEPGARGSAAGGAPEGAGLGLALSRRLARAAGGDVTATPDPGGGRFTIRLPGA
jgi:nitrogen-specific signal transduction histidine kinase